MQTRMYVDHVQIIYLTVMTAAQIVLALVVKMGIYCIKIINASKTVR